MVRLASVFTLAVAGLVAAAPIRLSKRAAFALQEYVPKRSFTADPS